MVDKAVCQRVFIWIFCLCGCLLGGVGQAFAQNVDEPALQAEEDFLRGVGAYESGQYEEAIVSFQRAFRFKDRPNLAFNIAMSFEQLKDIESAAAWFRKYRKLRTVDELGIDQRLRDLEGTIPALQNAAGVSPVTGIVDPYEATALGVGVVGLIGASILGSMALYYSGRTEETADLKRQGVYARHAEGYALSTDVTLILSIVGLAYGGSSLFESSVTSK
jgi:tetratricopeptide (TPR) repeat protein